MGPEDADSWYDGLGILLARRDSGYEGEGPGLCCLCRKGTSGLKAALEARGGAERLVYAVGVSSSAGLS